MLKRSHAIICEVFRVADLVIIVGAWLASYGLRYYFTPIEITGGVMPPFETYSALSPLVGVLWITVFTLLRLYESHRITTLREELLVVLKAHVVAMMLFVAVTYTFKEYNYSRLVIAYFGTLGAAALITFRILLRSTLRHLRSNGYNMRNLLVVGQGPQVESLLGHLDNNVELGVRVVGLVVHESTTGSKLYGKKILGRYEDVDRLVIEHEAGGVLVALPAAHQGHIDGILRLLADETIDVHVVPDLQQYTTLGCQVERFYDLPVLRINDSPMGGWAALMKRLTDITAASLGILLISPLLLIIASCVKATSRGPILYAQERMGLDGKTFRMLKFRSMRTDAETQSGAVWAQKGDGRCTPLGAFLRKTSLDELPQLWNVVRGDMSLVGPRPERPVFVTQFRKEIPHYMLRHKVKAGITGWAQINGWRGNTALDRRIECDLYYIQNWSYFFDLKILTMTIWKGFVNKNAY